MDHPDFRVGGKIFASLGYPDEGWGMANLMPADQQEFLRTNPAFKPASGAWGTRGATMITLADADGAEVRRALAAAWRKVAPKKLVRSIEADL